MKEVNLEYIQTFVVIQRKLLSIVLTTFIPTIILNVIGHMSNYFKEFFFEGLMSLNVTVMLVLTTMFLRFEYFQQEAPTVRLRKLREIKDLKIDLQETWNLKVFDKLRPDKQTDRDLIVVKNFFCEKIFNAIQWHLLIKH